jgi:hypothetical protein
MEIFPSDKPNKRFVAILENGKKIYFGQPNAHTYIDGADETVRANYRKRHLANKTEKKRIDNLIPSAALFSYYLNWGDSRSLKKNAKSLTQRLGRSIKISS